MGQRGLGVPPFTGWGTGEQLLEWQGPRRPEGARAMGDPEPWVGGGAGTACPRGPVWPQVTLEAGRMPS